MYQIVSENSILNTVELYEAVIGERVNASSTQRKKHFVPPPFPLMLAAHRGKKRTHRHRRTVNIAAHRFFATNTDSIVGFFLQHRIGLRQPAPLWDAIFSLWHGSFRCVYTGSFVVCSTSHKCNNQLFRFDFSITSIRLSTGFSFIAIAMESTSISRTSPEEGHRVHWPKRRELSSQQDEDKSPNNYSNNTIPSSTKLRKKNILLCFGNFFQFLAIFCI